jgi:uncharacterized protein YjdB
MKARILISDLRRKSILFLVFTFFFQFLFGQSVQFDLATLNFNGFTAPTQGTALKFGPDNKLYLAQLNGLIRVYTIGNSGSNSYTVTALETISHVRSIPNHDDTGIPAWDGRSNRQITGIEVVGASESPIIYVGSSDPKWGGPSGDKVLDTNSGIITKLTWTGTEWDVVDLVRGLPRSEENHSTNAVKHTFINNKPFLLVASGGFTNAGSPSTNFTWITEYALSAAILSVDLDAIEALPTKTDPNTGRKFKYDIPTLDDPSRPNVNGIYDPNHPDYDGIDIGDPWGGNDGLNMGMLVEGGPVQIFSPGYRNAYDFVVTEAGKVFVSDNGPNANWGGLPENEGNPNTVTNNYVPGELGGNSTNLAPSGEYVTNRDRLLMITNNINNFIPGSFYGGHPTPIRANPGIPYTSGATFPFNPGGAGLYTKSIDDEYKTTTLIPLYTQNEIFRTQVLQPIPPGSPGFDHYAQTSLPANWPPVPLNLRNLNEADYRDPQLGNLNGPQPQFVTMWKINTNGMDEYKASNFQGTLKGSIIAGRNNGYLHLVRLNPDGTLLSLEQDKWNLNGGNALGINCQGDNDIFPGTIWVATFNNLIHILTPANIPFCPAPNDPFFDPDADYDGDGYTNQDEIDNGTDYCSGASRPNDFDGDFVSDLNDLDDDGDGIPDELDPFQLGSPTDLPIDNELFSDKTDDLGRPFGYRGLGLTGLMNNGAPNPNWLNWLDKLDEGPLPNDIYGGAAGAIQIAITGGTANGNANNQEKGFQFGANVGLETGEFMITGGLLGFQGPQMFYDIDHNGELGIQMGDGTQSNFMKLVFTKTGIMAGMEINDIPDPNPLLVPLALADRPLSSETVEFMFRVNPSNGTVVPQVKIGQRPIISLGTKTLTGNILEAVQDFSKPLAIGVFGTSGNQGVEFLATYDYFRVFGDSPFITNPMIDISRQVGYPLKEIDLSDYFDDNGGFENLDFSLENTNPTIGAVIVGSILTIQFPDSPAHATITVRASDQNGFYVEQSFDVSVFASEQTVFRINAGGQLIEGQTSSQDWKSNESNGSYNGDGYTVDSGIVKNSSLSFENRHGSIPGYIDAATFDGVFAKERENNGQGSMIFSIPMDQGEYIVRLYFGNSASSTSNIGDRYFDVRIEDQLVYNDLDLVQRFGHGSAGMEEFSANVNDGVLNIEFIKQKGNPTISAIEVLRAVSPPPPLIFLNSVEDQVSMVNEVLDGDLLLTASGGVGALYYSAVNLPPGVNIEEVNGRLYGTIASNALANSPYTVTVTVTDSNSPVANTEFVSFTWIILPDDNWTPLNENQNYTARHENSFVQAGERFYMMGGRENSRTIDVYNYNEDSWKALSNVAPVSFNHFQATEYQGYIWVIGAFEDNNFPNEKPASHIYIFDPVKELYFQGPEIPEDRRRGSAGLVVYNDKFYVVAGNKLGHSGEYVDYFDEYDPVSGIWTVLPNAPRPRDHFHASVIGNKMYVASGRLSGGFGGTFGPVIKEVDVYDFDTQSWSTLPSALDIPTPRAAAVVANFGGKLLVAGGEVPDNTEALDITEIFDPATQTWSTGASLNFRRHGTQGIVSGNGLFVAGGSPVRGGGRQRNMEFYGLNNPTGTPIIESTLSGPENIILGSDNEASLVLSTSTGNQGVFIQNISLSGTDANDFTIETGNLSKSVIKPNSTHNIELVYQGTKESPVANLVIQYKTNSTLTIPIQRSAIGIEGFTLINANNTSDIQDIVHGTQLSLTQVQGLSLNFRANTNSSQVGSVFISLAGPISSSRFDNEQPYTLLDNDGFDFPIGNYTLTATPYSQSSGSGDVGQTLSIDFSVIDSGSTPVSGISVSPSTASIQVASTQQITATISPSDATHQTVIWSTSNANIATVSNTGLVTGIAQGTANITAQTEDGGFTAVSSITVEQSGSNDLIGHWKMDEGSGDTFLDYSGNGNDASIPNPSGISWVPGKIGMAARFNTTTGSYGSVSHNSSVDLKEELTIAAWIRPNAVENKGILTKLSGDGYEFRIFSDGKLEFRINRQTSGTAYRLKSNQNYVADGSTWMHVAATFNGTKSSIYINGVEDNSATFSPIQIISNTADLVIGAVATGNRWNGDLDDVRLYGRALNGTEILELFNTEVSVPVPLAPGLISPVINATDIPAALGTILSWEDSEFAQDYRVQLASDSQFTNIIFDQSEITGTSFPTPELSPLTQYFWRVRASNSEGISNWSSTWSFTTSDESVSDLLLGHWKMDEGSGNMFIDHSGNGNDASIPNPSGVAWVQGIRGLAARFNSSDGAYGSVPHNPTIDITQQLTIAAWIRPNAVENKGILTKLSGDGYEFRIFSDGKLEFRVNRQSSGTSYRLKSNKNYVADGSTWMHVAATFDGTSSTIYINGVKDNSTTFAPVQIISNTANLAIGAVATGNRWNGDLDDVRLYGRALNETEIFGLFNGEIPEPGIPELLSPVNSGIGIPASLGTVLSWEASEFALSYRVQLALDAGFSEIISDQSSVPETNSLTPPLSPLTQYFWRVRASNSEGESDWSATWSFTTADESVSDNLVGYWKMDEGSGNIFIDHSGNGNDASIPNPSGVTWVTGIRGLAARFNTLSGAYGSVPNNSSINLTDQLTISAWIRPNAVENKGILTKLSGDGYEFRIFSDGKLEFRINRSTSGTAYRLKSNQNYSADGSTWMHVAATFDGTRSTIYINGAEDNSATFAPVQIISNSADLRIGAVGNNNRWNGDLDDVRLYGRALGASEISDLFTEENTVSRILDGNQKGQTEFEPSSELSISPIDQDNMFGFKIYPNPVEDRLFIQMHSKEIQHIELAVYDMMGRQYISRSAVPDNGKIILDLSGVNMAKGTYLLILENGNGLTQKIKFIKK